MTNAAPLTDTLTGALESVLRFGALMLRAGDAAFRVHEAMGLIATSLGIEQLSLHITVRGMTATARRGGEHVTLASEVGSLGIDAWRLGALERLARDSKPGLTPAALANQLKQRPAWLSVQTQLVEHPKYGTGTVVRREGDGEDAKITVNFPRYGLKKLVEKYAGLKRS